jgi:hypothetical protein
MAKWLMDGYARDSIAALCENGTVGSEQAIRGNRLAGKAHPVGYTPETPFDSIEGSHEYVALLAEALAEARREVEAEIAAAEHDHADRRKKALLLVSYNLAKLRLHITSSRRILNDLRTLRRLLLAERDGSASRRAAIAWKHAVVFYGSCSPLPVGGSVRAGRSS